MTGEALRIDFPQLCELYKPTNLSAYVHSLYSTQKVGVDNILFDIYIRLDASLPIIKWLIFLYH